jgi:hypothetical protein
MLPGAITAQGFLGDDDRFPADIIASDEKDFVRFGLDFAEIAATLRRLRDEGEKGLGEPITVDRRWVVQTGDARGVLPCPWGDGVFHKNGISVRLVQPGKPIEACIEGEDILVFSDLSIHLLEVHHFLQGRGSPFRLDPAVLKSILK